MSSVPGTVDDMSQFKAGGSLKCQNDDNITTIIRRYHDEQRAQKIPNTSADEDYWLEYEKFWGEYAKYDVHPHDYRHPPEYIDWDSLTKFKWINDEKKYKKAMDMEFGGKRGIPVYRCQFHDEQNFPGNYLSPEELANSNHTRAFTKYCLAVCDEVLDRHDARLLRKEIRRFYKFVWRERIINFSKGYGQFRDTMEASRGTKLDELTDRVYEVFVRNPPIKVRIPKRKPHWKDAPCFKDDEKGDFDDSNIRHRGAPRPSAPTDDDRSSESTSSDAHAGNDDDIIVDQPTDIRRLASTDPPTLSSMLPLVVFLTFLYFILRRFVSMRKHANANADEVEDHLQAMCV